MKIIHMIPHGQTISLSDMQDAVSRFHAQFKIKPTTLKLAEYDLGNFLRTMYNQGLLTLEVGKQYANYVNTSCGPIMLDLMDEEMSISFKYDSNNPSSSAAIIVENDHIDKEFEKHILNKDK